MLGFCSCLTVATFLTGTEAGGGMSSSSTSFLISFSTSGFSSSVVEALSSLLTMADLSFSSSSEESELLESSSDKASVISE